MVPPHSGHSAKVPSGERSHDTGGRAPTVVAGPDGLLSEWPAAGVVGLAGTPLRRALSTGPMCCTSLDARSVLHAPDHGLCPAWYEPDTLRWVTDDDPKARRPESTTAGTKPACTHWGGAPRGRNWMTAAGAASSRQRVALQLGVSPGPQGTTGIVVAFGGSRGPSGDREVRQQR